MDELINSNKDSRREWINWLILILVVIGIASMIGFSVVNMIDQKISDITIKIPEINVPKPEIIVNTCDETKRYPSIEQFSKSTDGSPKSADGCTTIPNNIRKKIAKLMSRPRDLNLYKAKNPVSVLTGETAKQRKDREDYLGPIIEEERLRRIQESQLGLDKYVGEVMGCTYKGTNKLKADQIACGYPNYKTAENYYRYYFKFPFIPQSEDERFLGANYNQYSDLMYPQTDFRIVPRGKKKLGGGLQPFPSNYAFTFKDEKGNKVPYGQQGMVERPYTLATPKVSTSIAPPAPKITA